MSKNNVFKRWNKRSLKFKIITAVLFIAALIVLPYFLLAVFVMVVAKMNFIGAIHSGLLYGLWGVALLGILLFVLFEYRTLGSRRVMKVNKDIEDSHFMSKWEIAHNDGFIVTRFDNLNNVNDGLLISAERKGKSMKMDVVLHNPIHSLIIATTGTGKTSTYVSPFIEVVSRTSTKPCMVITDPKGELYARHANTLEANGYKVHVIDMANTYNSTLWNPFHDVWKKTVKMSDEITQEKNKYRWGGDLFDTYAAAEQQKRECAVRLNDDIYQDMLDLIYTAFPVEVNQQEKSWQQGARDLILGMALRMWEDARDGYMPEEKFNLYNLWWNLTEYAKPDPESGLCEVLNRYIVNCADETSRAPGMANTVLVSQDKTLTSYLGSVNQYLHWLGDGGVTQLTSGNDIEFSEWDEDANVLFIKFPEEKENRHGLVALLLVQMYKALLEKCGVNSELKVTSDRKLKRTCYFLMDEFGQLPRVNRFEKIIPIARSKRIFFFPVIQSYTQLDAVYGEKDANSIKDNCPIKIFLGTDNPKTCEEFSNACGKHKVKRVSYSENKDMSVSTSAESQPLIFPAELSKLNDPDNKVFGNSIIKDVNLYPIRAHSTPYFQAMEIYGIVDGAEIPKKNFMFFDEKENRYDVTHLIFLHENLDNDDEDESEQSQLPVDTFVSDIADVNPQKKLLKLLPKQIDAEIEKLRGKISNDDMQLLKMATLSEKIALLDEIAEKATFEGNMFLAMQIEKIISILRNNKYIFDEAASAG